MSDNNNPYNAPASDVNNNITERSSMPKVIGIIAIILGILGLVGSLFSVATFAFMGSEMSQMAGLTGINPTFLLGSAVISVITSAWLIFIGFKLKKYLDLGRRHFNYYTIVTIIVSIVSFFYTKSMMESMFKDLDPAAAEAASGAATMGALSSFIAPVLLIIIALLLNKQKVKDSLS